MANFHVHAVLSLPSRLGAPRSQFLELGLGYFCIRLSISRRRKWLCLESVKWNIDQVAEFLLVGLIIGYIWCMYSRYFKMVMTWFKPAQQSYDMIFVDTEDQCHGICGGRQPIYTCGCTNSIFLQECMANFHVHAVLSLPSYLGAPRSQFLEWGLGYFCIGLSISRRREWLCL